MGGANRREVGAGVDLAVGLGVPTVGLGDVGAAETGGVVDGAAVPTMGAAVVGLIDGVDVLTCVGDGVASGREGADEGDSVSGTVGANDGDKVVGAIVVGELVTGAAADGARVTGAGVTGERVVGAGVTGASEGGTTGA